MASKSRLSSSLVLSPKRIKDLGIGSGDYVYQTGSLLKTFKVTPVVFRQKRSRDDSEEGRVAREMFMHSLCNGNVQIVADGY